MSLTTLDPHTALIVVDLQAGVIGLPAVHPIADEYSIRNVFPRLGETGTAHDIISLLDTQGA